MKNKLLQQSSCVSGRVVTSMRRFSQATSPFRLPFFHTHAILPTYKNTCYEHLIVVGVLRWTITETWCNKKESNKTGSPIFLVPKVCFWVTNITQSGHIYWSQNNLVYIYMHHLALRFPTKDVS